MIRGEKKTTRKEETKEETTMRKEEKDVKKQTILGKQTRKSLQRTKVFEKKISKSLTVEIYICIL